MTQQMRDMGITPREKQVMDLIIDCYPNKEIAALLGIALGTVKVHIYSLFNKTGCDSRMQLAMKFYQGEPHEEVAIDFDAYSPSVLPDVVQGR